MQTKLHSLNFLCRKMIRRIATPDLMFGHMIAPPPRGVTSQLESLDIADVLNSFTDQGSPTTSNLSPIAMVTTTSSDIHRDWASFFLQSSDAFFIEVKGKPRNA